MDYTQLLRIGYKARSDDKRIEELDQTAFEPCMGFDTRDSYFEWRQAWREEYANLSEHIRWLKTERGTLARAGDPEAGSMQASLVGERFKARLMCQLRRASKRRAGQLAEQARMAA